MNKNKPLLGVYSFVTPENPNYRFLDDLRYYVEDLRLHPEVVRLSGGVFYLITYFPETYSYYAIFKWSDPTNMSPFAGVRFGQEYLGSLLHTKDIKYLGPLAWDEKETLIEPPTHASLEQIYMCQSIVSGDYREQK